jgi:hypothetical protein
MEGFCYLLFCFWFPRISLAERWVWTSSRNDIFNRTRNQEPRVDDQGTCSKKNAVAPFSMSSDVTRRARHRAGLEISYIPSHNQEGPGSACTSMVWCIGPTGKRYQYTTERSKIPPCQRKKNCNVGAVNRRKATRPIKKLLIMTVEVLKEPRRLREPISSVRRTCVNGSATTKLDEPNAAPLSVLLNWASEMEK